MEVFCCIAKLKLNGEAGIFSGGYFQNLALALCLRSEETPSAWLHLSAQHTFNAECRLVQFVHGIWSFVALRGATQTQS